MREKDGNFEKKMALQFLLVVALLTWGEPVASQMTDMYDSTDMYDTTDESQYATPSDTGMSNQGNPPQNDMNPTGVNSVSRNGSEIITGEVKPNLFKYICLASVIRAKPKKKNEICRSVLTCAVKCDGLFFVLQHGFQYGFQHA